MSEVVLCAALASIAAGLIGGSDYLHPSREDLASALAALDDGWNS